jgi:hypothetical protein
MLPPTAPTVEAMRIHEHDIQQAKEEYRRRTGMELPEHMLPRIRFLPGRLTHPIVCLELY